jgi:mannosyltransferase
MNSAIIYLLRSTEIDVINIIRSLNSLYENFLINYNYPVLIFVEKNFTQEFKNEICNNIKFEITFQDINFKSYSELNDKRIPEILITHNGNQKWPLGYRSMCRFWTGDFLDNEIISKYKYIWRMDNDAYITNKINYDIFKYMSEKEIAYGYSNICDDEAEVCVDLNDFSKNFFENKKINYNWDLYKMFTTHVEIINVDILKNSIYYDYYKEIDKTNNFYIKRWGDAPIRYIAIKNMNLKHEHLNINYYHGNDGSGRRIQIEKS